MKGDAIRAMATADRVAALARTRGVRRTLSGHADDALDPVELRIAGLELDRFGDVAQRILVEADRHVEIGSAHEIFRLGGIELEHIGEARGSLRDLLLLVLQRAEIEIDLCEANRELGIVGQEAMQLLSAPCQVLQSLDRRRGNQQRLHELIAAL